MVKKKARSKSPAMPGRIFAEASVHSIGGRSLFADDGEVSVDSVQNYASETSLTRDAIHSLEKAGFEVLAVGDATINIAGSRQLFEQAFGTKLHTEQHKVLKQRNVEELAEFVCCDNQNDPSLIIPKAKKTGGMANYFEGIAINEPVYYFSPLPYGPRKSYWHLTVPGDVSAALNSDKAHRAGLTGKGVDVVMVDSGWYKHPFFQRRGYRAGPVVLGPGASNPLADESGHGTAESANVFAVAPDVNFRMVKMNFANSIGSFNAAVGLEPDIISCSWGSSRKNTLTAANRTLGAAVASAVARGITVVFSAGNGHWGFPGQHPDVISAGGVHMKDDGSLEASDYSSGFDSNIYPGRVVPDVSGLVGMQPGANYIMLPVEPNDNIDRNVSGGNWPGRDETDADDGWAAISGTSAAAPQIAGACALIKQACRFLTPSQIRSILQTTAVDVTTGQSQQGNTATSGPDNATGNGLIDAYRAAMIARLRCLIRRPIPPIPRLPTPIRWPRPIPPLPPLPGPRPLPPGPRPGIGAPLSSTEDTELSEQDVVALEDFILDRGNG